MSRIQFGYKLMSEEHGPPVLVRNARRAEKAGFDFVAISDHFHPWIDEQGHSPYAWSVLGAIAAATDRIEMVTAVTCPFRRYHPAIVAQSAATVSLLADGRLTALGVGAGENLNEHVVDGRWPSVTERHEMLAEAVDIIRLLWKGGYQSYQGRHLSLRDARLYDLPPALPLIAVAVSGSKSVRLAAEKGDGIFSTEPSADLIGEWKRLKKGDGPYFAECPMSWAPDERQAKERAHRFFRWSGLGWGKMSELATPGDFEKASRDVTADQLAERIPCGPDPERHLAAVRAYLEAGCDRIVLVGIGHDQEGFLRFWEKELAPRLRKLAA